LSSDGRTTGPPLLPATIKPSTTSNFPSRCIALCVALRLRDGMSIANSSPGTVARYPAFAIGWDVPERKSLLYAP